MVLRELLIRLGLSGGEETGRGLDGVDKKVNNLTDSFRGLGGVITGVFAGLSIKSIIDTADHMQSLEFRLGQMQTSANGGADAFDNLANHAQTARVSIESYAEAYTGIGAATHELIHTQEDLLNVTDSVAMGLQLAGANTQQTTSVMQQLTQAVAVGKLQWEDMRVIMQNSDAFASRLAKSLGMTLNQMVKATQGQGGGIGADKIINALRNMSGQVRKEFASMPMTVGQAIQTIGARWDAFIARMNRSTHTVSQIANWFLWLADKVEYAMDVCVDAVGGADNAVRLLAAALGGLGIVASVMAIRAAVVALASPIALVALAAASLYLAFDDFRTWQQGGDSVLGKLFGDYAQYKPTIDNLLTSMHSVLDMIGGWKTVFEGFGIYLAGAWLTNVLKTLGLVRAEATVLSTVIATMMSRLAILTAGMSLAYEAYSNISNAATSKDGTGSLWESIKGRVAAGGWYNYNQQQMGGNSTSNTSSQNLNYQPNINLTVNSPSGTPEDIQQAVQGALDGHIQTVQNRFSSDLLFNGGVNR